jgi:hypothetical protein
MIVIYNAIKNLQRNKLNRVILEYNYNFFSTSKTLQLTVVNSKEFRIGSRLGDFLPIG